GAQRDRRERLARARAHEPEAALPRGLGDHVELASAGRDLGGRFVVFVAVAPDEVHEAGRVDGLHATTPPASLNASTSAAIFCSCCPYPAPGRLAHRLRHFVSATSMRPASMSSAAPHSWMRRIATRSCECGPKSGRLSSCRYPGLSP